MYKQEQILWLLIKRLTNGNIWLTFLHKASQTFASKDQMKQNVRHLRKISSKKRVNCVTFLLGRVWKLETINGPVSYGVSNVNKNKRRARSGSIKKMIKIESEAILELKKKTDEIKKLTKNFVSNYCEKI